MSNDIIPLYIAMHNYLLLKEQLDLIILRQISNVSSMIFIFLLGKSILLLIKDLCSSIDINPWFLCQVSTRPGNSAPSRPKMTQSPAKGPDSPKTMYAKKNHQRDCPSVSQFYSRPTTRRNLGGVPYACTFLYTYAQAL